ncbi:MAG TPA: hypothetical protein PKE20_11850, partial [Promineifilum sp.]|nr:hypothetical protein [Promineifilum sp.]
MGNGYNPLGRATQPGHNIFQENETNGPRRNGHIWNFSTARGSRHCLAQAGASPLEIIEICVISQRENRIRIWLLIALTGLVFGAVLWAQSPSQPTGATEAPPPPLVVRIYYQDIREIQELQSLDLWEYNNLEERYVLASVNAALYRSLVEQGWRVAIDHTASAQLSHSFDRAAEFFGGYRSVNELYALLESINQAAPQLTEIIEYGPSHCLTEGGCTTPGGDNWPGVPLRAIRVTNEAISGASSINGGTVTRGEKPIFFLMAGIHCPLNPRAAVVGRILETLCNKY